MTVVLSAVVVALAGYVTAGSATPGRGGSCRPPRGGRRWPAVRHRAARCRTTRDASRHSGTGIKIPFPAVVNESGHGTCRKRKRVRRHPGVGDHRHRRRRPAGEAKVLSQAGQRKAEAARWARVRLADPSKIDLQAPSRSRTGTCGTATQRRSARTPRTPPPAPGNLTFKPILRGMLCLDQPWSALYTAPAVDRSDVPPPPAPASTARCKVWSPGKYTTSAGPRLGQLLQVG